MRILKGIIALIRKEKKIKIVIENTKKETDDMFSLEYNKALLDSKNTKQYENLISIDGIGCSGSSAVTDFLGEFSSCTVLGGADKDNMARGIENTFEVDFFRNPYSVLELEKICDNYVHRIRNKAIHDFINTIKNNYKSPISLYDDFYLNASKKFISNILSYIVPLRYGQLQYIPKKLSRMEYRKEAKSYLLSILKNIPSEKNLVFDNLLSIGEPNTDLLHDYFGEFKLIYVYSDPRDVYVRARNNPGDEWVPVDPELFVKFYLKEFPFYLASNSDSILCISFDELIYKYNETTKKIMDFIGLKEEEHILKYKFFNPEYSIKNTRVYKNYKDQSIIKYIEKNLKQYCYSE